MVACRWTIDDTIELCYAQLQIKLILELCTKSLDTVDFYWLQLLSNAKMSVDATRPMPDKENECNECNCLVVQANRMYKKKMQGK